jgi:hypothetical protein
MNTRFLQFVPLFQTCGQEQHQRCLKSGTLDMHELYKNLSQFLEARRLFLQIYPSISTYMSQRHEFGYMTAALVYNDHLGMMLKIK